MPTKQQTLVGQLLLRMAALQRSRSRSYPQDVGAAAEELAWRYPLAKDEALEAAFTKGTAPPVVNLLEWGRFVQLPALEEAEWMIPILTVKADFASAAPELRVRVALFMRSEESEPPRAMGYRFETPESDTGAHAFYHVQHITSFRKDGDQWPFPSVSWTPTKQPSVPLMAQNPVELLLCVFCSMYGLERTIVDSLQGASFLGPLRQFLQSGLIPLGASTSA
jgi:hypothetical protein